MFRGRRRREDDRVSVSSASLFAGSHTKCSVGFPVTRGVAESLNPQIMFGVYSFSRKLPDPCSGLSLLSVPTPVTCISLLQRPQPSAETKTQTPKFDLLASNFPPLPGSTAKILGEPVLESRMSDIVKGVCKEKVPDLVSVHTWVYLGAVTPFSLLKGWLVRAKYYSASYWFVHRMVHFPGFFCGNAAGAYAVMLS